MAAQVEHIVVDSGAFIRNAPIKDIASNVYTIKEVVSEIRDKATRERLRILPYELNFLEPESRFIQTVTDFTKKTGDYPSLSATDIKVMALTYQLESQHVGADHIKTTPSKKVEICTGSTLAGPGNEIAGFYVGQNHQSSQSSSSKEASTLPNTASPETAETKSTDAVAQSNNPHKSLNDGDMLEANVTAYGSSGESEDEDEGVGDDEDDEADDEDGWITPGNVDSMNMKMTGTEPKEASSCRVGCLTTDFAMQNVLIQMGLNVISTDGLLIKKAKNYVLRCYSCFKISTNMTKEFCYHCGNQTLRKLSVTVKEDGTLQYFLSRRTPRIYKKPALPLPKGGKYSTYPKLTEDQRLPQRRHAKPREQHYGVFDPDFTANASPFALRDTTSRSAMLGVGKNFNKRNPTGGGRRRRK